MISVAGIRISYVSRDPWLLTRLDREASADACADGESRRWGACRPGSRLRGACRWGANAGAPVDGGADAGAHVQGVAEARVCVDQGADAGACGCTF